jgi:hypothetical protein
MMISLFLFFILFIWLRTSSHVFAPIERRSEPFSISPCDNGKLVLDALNTPDLQFPGSAPSCSSLIQHLAENYTQSQQSRGYFDDPRVFDFTCDNS